MKKLNNEYSDLMQQAQQATGRKEAVGLIHKAAKLKTKFDNYEMMQSVDYLTVDLKYWVQKSPFIMDRRFIAEKIMTLIISLIG